MINNYYNNQNGSVSRLNLQIKLLQNVTKIYIINNKFFLMFQINGLDIFTNTNVSL